MEKRNLLITAILIFVLLSIIIKNDWIDLLGFGGFMIVCLLNKENIVRGNADYGIYIFYTCLVLWGVLFISKLYSLISGV